MTTQRLEPPTIEQTQAWLEQLQDDQQEQIKVVKRCEDDLAYAKRNLDSIARDIKAAQEIIKTLRDAGHR